MIVSLMTRKFDAAVLSDCWWKCKKKTMKNPVAESCWVFPFYAAAAGVIER
jgi:hypothetical protein